MARDAEELTSILTTATDAGFRGRLLSRGQAQSMIRRAGVLPQGAPRFSPYLDADLLNFGYAVLLASLELLEISDDGAIEQIALAERGFIQSSYAIEAATRNAAPARDLVFHGLIAGAASHLAGYAARAFSLIQASRGSGRLTPMELTLADLLVRDVNSVEQRTQSLRTSPEVSDEALLAAFSADRDTAAFADNDLGQVGPVALLLSENYMSAVSAAMFAIEIGRRDLLEIALEELRLGEQAALDVSAAGPWWVALLTRHLMRGLFDTSLETKIPHEPPPGSIDDAIKWGELRESFVTSLRARRRSEIDLWPSQLHVVDRIFQDQRDLVVALPTSAGKTRIAELAILACLAQNRRTIYVTPLRALSAQTEHILARTFSPLGMRVSSLYGSMGTSDFDEDTLRSSPIVVATPEKLDFALRSDPTVLDDVGLVVLDEGHMIGATEREIRYEAQIQRLLRRPDASTRRILCLSAVFPSGSELDDFVAWITDDDPDGLHRETWRPTQQRFGLVEWRSDHARLSITIGPDQPYIPRYFEAATPRKPRRKPFPNNQREHVIATAWRLVEEGQTVLIFCPQRNWVEPYAPTIIKLHNQGLLDSVLPTNVDLSDALAVGTEWFGADHPILVCLKLGVAIHHGALPGPFRREVERLLQRGSLNVTVASPTLAQGLNLSASAVLFHGLRRGGALLNDAEFANVIGRAGRAFVDTEGLVLYPIFEPNAFRRWSWNKLTQGDGGKGLRSGLIEIGMVLLARITASHGQGLVDRALAYLTGGTDWSLPTVPHESDDDQGAAAEIWRSNLALLDIAILSIVGDGGQDADADAATQILADALHNSLWERQLRRLEIDSAALPELVRSRTKFLWRTATPSQRRGWYLAGLGADAGSELSLASAHIVGLAANAETAIENDDYATATNLLVTIAETIFALSVFEPETELANREEVVRHWVNGSPLGNIPGDPVAVAQFVETDLIYRLVWGIEAAKVYQTAQDHTELLSGTAVAAIETGTFNRSASILIRSGFDHRLAAISAATSTEATFESTAEMRQWIETLDPVYADSDHWPTPESRSAWQEFVARSHRRRSRRWRLQRLNLDEVTWFGAAPDHSTWLRVTEDDSGKIAIWSTGFDQLGEAAARLNRNRQGILRAQRQPKGIGIHLIYHGPGDLIPRIRRRSRPAP
ncbi:DEAD/DEAH box helicase [Nocardia beijingensis]|uniref:DEAD/DEAH box helicase n=1 Tax=Nocardia beijingensis TaxID=95162 RepID=A0ABW7W833_9NOCA